MPLIEIWNAAPKTIQGMLLPAIVNIATNGHILRDGSIGSQEFRQYLTEINSEKLSEYANYCIENAFPDSGQILQDVVNEIGRRLGFVAENGRYRGVRNDIGFDGIWTANEQSLVIEVKTTDAYTIKLDTIANYRDRLVEENRVPRDTPILIVIGRNDTSSLEAQVRGSRHAWSIRIVSIDALIKLMEVNLSTSSDSVTEKIHTILRPFEYTRIDQIVDVVFTTAEDKEQESIEIDLPTVRDEHNLPSTQIRTPREIIEKKKSDIVDRLSQREKCQLLRKRNSLYSDSSDSIHAVVAVSKRYESDNGYWYAYHNEPQRKFLSQSTSGYMILGMVDKDFAFAIPFSLLETHWDNLYETTTKDGRIYKHLLTYDNNDKFTLRVRNVGTEISLDQFKI
jgi:hypothetical protein